MRENEFSQKKNLALKIYLLLEEKRSLPDIYWGYSLQI